MNLPQIIHLPNGMWKLKTAHSVTFPVTYDRIIICYEQKTNTTFVAKTQYWGEETVCTIPGKLQLVNHETIDNSI